MLSIIIPMYNEHDMTYDCIQSIRNATDVCNCELIIIDNGSSPEFKTPFTGFIPVSVIRNEENKGFPVAVNQGIKAAKGDVIVLLNNDTIVPTGSLNNLAEYLDEYAIIGPMTNYCAGLQSVTIPAYNSLDDLNKEASFLRESERGHTEDVNFIIGFCMMFKKSLYDEIGEFDESLWPCSGEEIDFCFRTIEKGYRVGIAHDVYIHHFGSQTFKDLQESGQANYTEVCTQNDLHLAKKWGNDFWNKQKGAFFKTSTKNKQCLNLGSGLDPQPGYINCDINPEVNPDKVIDVLKVFPYEDSSIDIVRAYDFLEHIPLGKTIQVINEIWRVLKPDGIFDSFTPDAEFGQGAFQDPTHLSFWVENSFLYYVDAYYRNLYGIKANFKLESFDRIEDDGRIFHLHVLLKAIK